MIALDLIASLGSLIIPPAFDFIKKKFVSAENDTPERTIGSLATTKPEVLPDYTTALATLMDSKTKFFNRDVIGSPSQWIVDIRAAIRPITVILSLGVLVFIVYSVFMDAQFTKEQSDFLIGIRLSCESNVSSWLGSRLSLKS